MSRFEETKKKLKKYYREYPLRCSVDDIMKVYEGGKIMPAGVEIYHSTMKAIESWIAKYKMPDKIKDTYREAFKRLVKGTLAGGFYKEFGDKVYKEISEDLESIDGRAKQRIEIALDAWQEVKKKGKIFKGGYYKEIDKQLSFLHQYKEDKKNEMKRCVKGLFDYIYTSINWLKQTEKSEDSEDDEIKINTYFHQYIKENNFADLMNRFMDFTPSYERGGSKYFETEELVEKYKKGKIDKKEMIDHPFVKDSIFNDLLNSPLGFQIPFSKRFEHTHIVAGSGHGKTQLLLALIYNDLLKAQKGGAGLCVLDSQGDLIDVLSHLWMFDPKVENSLADKLILVDPNDIQYPISLNIFDMKLGGLKEISERDREMAFNFATSLYGYIFSDLVEGKLTMYQENVFQYCAKLLLTIPNVTILDFIKLLEGSEGYKEYLTDLDEITRHFFKDEFYSSVYESTKKQISARLWSVIRNNTFKNMFINPTNKIDMFKAMNQGKIILINTSKMLLQSEGARLLGKFFIALILQSTLLRAGIPEDKRKPFFVYIDEAQDYMTDMLADFLSQARKYGVGIILAHQYLKQLDVVSTNLRHSTLSNTTIKFVGKVDLADARMMGERIRVKPENILDLKKVDRNYTEYLCYVKDFTSQGIKAQVPLGMVNQKKSINEASFNSLIEMNRKKYCEELTSKKDVLNKPEKLGKKKVIEAKDRFKIGKRKKL